VDLILPSSLASFTLSGEDFTTCALRVFSCGPALEVLLSASENYRQQHSLSSTLLLFFPYPRHCEVIGIDLAADMLAQARAKIAKNSWSHLQVMEMDALNLSFADNSFDYVTAFHTVTVVPDPIRMLAEAKRICRPGGKIVIVNHFTTDLPIIGPLTEALDPVTRHLGWRTKLRLEPFLAATDFNVEEIYKISKLSLYTVVVGANQKESVSG
jgi:SAM-dependent methyltransferase